MLGASGEHFGHWHAVDRRRNIPKGTLALYVIGGSTVCHRLWSAESEKLMPWD
jgi:hypothetical protein